MPTRRKPDLGADDAALEPSSKTQLKREADALQKLGTRLAGLKPAQLDNLVLPERLSAAILEYQRLPTREAQRRQLQFIGRLMRAADTAGIEAFFAALDGQSAQQKYTFHQVEKWREDLLRERDALTRFVAAYPTVDRQQLRHLLRNVHKARDAQARKTGERALFRFIRALVDRSPAEEPPID
ncbi:MAG: ribosome biogenesis factor YjgA [Pseudomonadota bacterium]